MMDQPIPVGIQLYSLRTIIPEDVAGALKKLADMGYAGVEFAGYYGLGPAELRAMLDDAGLRCAGSHTGLPALEGDAFEKTVAMNKAITTLAVVICLWVAIFGSRKSTFWNTAFVVCPL